MVKINYYLFRYKKKYMDIYRKLAEYKETSASLDRRSDKVFRFEESRFPEINNKIVKFVNRTRQFPDFVDIKKLVEEVDQTKGLGLSENQVSTEEAKFSINNNIFTCIALKSEGENSEERL